MYRYQFDPNGHTQSYVDNVERKMQQAQLCREATGTKGSATTDRQPRLSLSQIWIRVRSNLATLRRQPASGA